jgi:hypothetical protein
MCVEEAQFIRFGGAAFYINFAECHEQLRLDDRGGLRKSKSYPMQSEPRCRLRDWGDEGWSRLIGAALILANRP